MSSKILVPTFLTVENTFNQPMELLVEPWYDLSTLKVKEKRWLVFVSSANFLSSPSIPLIRARDLGLTVYGWSGSEYRQFDFDPNFPIKHFCFDKELADFLNNSASKEILSNLDRLKKMLPNNQPTEVARIVSSLFLSRGLWIHEEEQLIRCMNNETCDIATSELLI